MARGDRRSSRRSDAPNPGRSIANRRACSAREAQIGAKAYRLSGQGLVSTTVGPCEPPPLSAYRIFTPSIVRNCGVIDAADELVPAVPPPPIDDAVTRRLTHSIGELTAWELHQASAGRTLRRGIEAIRL
jgi:hypothetical protein